MIYSQEKILQQTFWVLIWYQEGLAWLFSHFWFEWSNLIEFPLLEQLSVSKLTLFLIHSILVFLIFFQLGKTSRFALWVFFGTVRSIMFFFQKVLNVFKRLCCFWTLRCAPTWVHSWFTSFIQWSHLYFLRKFEKPQKKYQDSTAPRIIFGGSIVISCPIFLEFQFLWTMFSRCADYFLYSSISPDLLPLRKLEWKFETQGISTQGIAFSLTRNIKKYNIFEKKTIFSWCSLFKIAKHFFSSRKRDNN